VRRHKGELAVTVEAFFDDADQAFAALASAIPAGEATAHAPKEDAPAGLGAKVAQSLSTVGSVMDGLSGAIDAGAKQLSAPGARWGLTAVLEAIDKLKATQPR
jgi:hypothetical protein